MHLEIRPAKRPFILTFPGVLLFLCLLGLPLLMAAFISSKGQSIKVPAPEKPKNQVYKSSNDLFCAVLGGETEEWVVEEFSKDSDTKFVPGMRNYIGYPAWADNHQRIHLRMSIIGGRVPGAEPYQRGDKWYVMTRLFVMKNHLQEDKVRIAVATAEQ